MGDFPVIWGFDKKQDLTCSPDLPKFVGHWWRDKCKVTGAYAWEHANPLYSCHGVFIGRFIFRSNLLWMRLPWECHNQSQDTNWRHCVTGPELPFFHKRKDVLKIDQSVKMPWHRLSMGVASSCSLASDNTETRGLFQLSILRSILGSFGECDPQVTHQKWKSANG